MHSYETEFYVWDIDALGQLDKMQTLYPAWQRDVKCVHQQIDVTVSYFSELLDQYAKTFQYIVVALGNDELSLQTAIQLCRYYRRLRWEEMAQNSDYSEPMICVRILDAAKGKLLQELADKEQWYTHLHVFGSLSELYSEKVLTPTHAWEAAAATQQIIRGKENDEERYCWSEYERRSSLAAAYHAGSHIFSVVGHPAEKGYFSAAQLQQYEDSLVVDSDKANLIAAEHQRWENYVRSEGMQHASVDLVRAYLPSLNTHVDSFARLTPCIVEAGSTGISNLTPKEKMEKLETLYQTLLQEYDDHPDVRRDAAQRFRRHSFIHNDEQVVANAVRIYNMLNGLPQNAVTTTKAHPTSRPALSIGQAKD